MRRLEVTVAGKWFVGLTVLLGVVAINSGNNVIYLIESMLLSGLILSGILSERAISSVKINIHRNHCFAKGVSRDVIELENKSRFFLFCIEVGEWRGKKFVPLAFVSRLAPKKKIAVSSQYVYEERGVHNWDGLVVATMYPFGFARKLKVVKQPGARIVWPALANRGRAQQLMQEAERRRDRDLEISEGDVRRFQDGDDPKQIVWTLSAKKEEFWVRERRQSLEPKEFILDISGKAGPALEQDISNMSAQIELTVQGGTVPTLIIRGEVSERFNSRIKALDALAMVKAA